MVSTAEYSRKVRAELKEFIGWERRLGIPKEMPGHRLCLRPVRVPGVVPACEDDALDVDYHANSDEGRERRARERITLPRVAWLERRAV